MTNNTYFRAIADRFRQSAFIMPIFLVFLLLAAISLALSWQDYWTSKWGYDALPTQQGFVWVAYFVAGLPQVGQAAALYIAIALKGSAIETDRNYAIVALIIWFVLFLIDAYTDVFYRINIPGPLTGEVWFVAVFQTVGIFTLGSEIAFVAGWGMVFELAPDAIAEMLAFIGRTRNSLQGRSTRGVQQQQNRYEKR